MGLRDISSAGRGLGAGEGCTREKHQGNLPGLQFAHLNVRCYESLTGQGA